VSTTVSKAHEAFYARNVPETGRKRNLLALSFAEVAERLREPGQDVVLVPLGSTEKHGAHIPLGTDSYITMTAVAQAAELADCLYPRSCRSGTGPTTWDACTRARGRSRFRPRPTGASCTTSP
jgi:hypothetical protein